MLIRQDSRGAIVIGQPSHAWISGQLARRWGNTRFGSVEPFEEVCLAAEQHDIGMAMWDLEPARNPESGLPASFLQMAIPDHIALWTAAPRRLLRQSRYAALLVSLHGTRLYAHRDVSAFLGLDRSLVLEFLEGQRLTATFDDDAAMQQALAAAPWETLEFELVPA